MAKYSDWRDDLREVMDDDTDKKKVTGKGCDNKKLIKINPKLGEAVEQIGGQILEVAEVDTVDGEEEDKAKKFEKEKQDKIEDKNKKKEMMLKKRIVRMKMMAVNQGAGDSLVAHHEPEGELIEGKKKGLDGKACWDGYKLAGTKKKGGKTVDNCVKEASVALDANTAIRNVERKEKLKRINKTLQAMRKNRDYHPLLHSPKGGATAADLRGEEVEKVDEGVMKMVKKVIRSKKPAKKATMDATTDKLHDWRQKNSDEQKDREKYVSPFRPIVKEADDKAYKYVVSQLKKKYGDGVLTKGDKMPQPSAAQKKKNDEIRAKRAKEDGRDATEKASDGRYSDRYSNRGSD